MDSGCLGRFFFVQPEPKPFKWALRQKQHPHQLDICKNQPDDQLSGSKCLDYAFGNRPFKQCQSVFRNHAILVSASGILIATMATIIASQALISGLFTLISEAMSMNYWPRVTVRQPTNLKGQIYIPSVNTIIWVGCILTVLYFRSSSEMEAAYGFFDQCWPC